MASVAQMKEEAAKQGASAPPDYPGGPEQWVQDWYANAKAAGSVVSERAADYAGPNDAEAQGHNYSQNVSGSSGWKPGQAISPQQLRQHSREQGWSEDFNRYSDAQLQAWIDQSWDSNAGKFKSEHGAEGHFEKPTECPPGTTLHGSKCVSWDQLPAELGGTQGLPPGAKPIISPGSSAPAAPTTFGSQLSYTGNPLTDMLLYQFNTGAQLSDPSKLNMFNLGGDRQEGGADGDKDSQDRQGQLLKGGGLWWSNDKDAFGGFRADTKNAEPSAANPLAAPAPAAAPQGGQPQGAPQASSAQQQPSAANPLAVATTQDDPKMGQMLASAFKAPRGGQQYDASGSDPFRIQAF